MALEDMLKDLTTALKENTEVTKTLISLRADAIETVKSAAASAPKAAAKETKPAAETKPEPEAPAAPAVDAKVYEELAQSVAEYVGGTTREDERAARKAKVRTLLQHEQIKKPGTAADVFDTANIREDAIQLFKDNMQALKDKGDLTPAPSTTSLV